MMPKIKSKHEEKVLQWVPDAQNSTTLSNLRAEARANRDFYRGDQWAKADRKYYLHKGVQPVTVNRIKPVVKTALGIYLQNKQDIRLVSNSSSAGYVTGVANKVLKNAEQRSDSQKKYERLFMYGAVDKVSFLKYETNMYRTVNGQPELKVLTVFEVDYDPSCKSYNLNDDCRYIIEKEWLDKDEAELIYSNTEFVSSSKGKNSKEALKDFLTGNNTSNPSDSDEFDIDAEVDTILRNKNKVMIKHCWWKELVNGFVVTDGKQKRFTPDKEVADQLKEAGYKVKVVPNYKLHKTTVYNGQIVAEEVEPLGEGISAFPFFRYSPLFYDGANIGIVDNLLSLNVEENNYRTLVQKYLMNSINSGYKVNGGSEEAKNDLSNNAGRDDIVIDLRKYGGIVEEIGPKSLPAAFEQQAGRYEELVKSVSGISDSMLGSDGNESSGRAIYLRTQQNKIQFQEILENLFTTIQQYGNFLFQYIITNNVYTDDEIIKIVDESDLIDPQLFQKATDMLTQYTGGIQLPKPQMPAPPSPELMAMIRPEDKPRLIQQVQIGTKAAQDYAEQYPRMQKNFDNTVRMMAKRWLLEQYRSEDFKDYSVDVVTSPHAPNEAMAVFAQAIDLNNAMGGGALPASVLIDLSILPERTKQEIKQNGMVAPQPMLQNNTSNIMGQMAATGQM